MSYRIKANNLLRDKIFKRIFFSLLFLLFFVFLIIFIGCFRAVMTDINNERREKIEVTCADIQKQLDEVSASILLLQKTVNTLRWTDKLMSGNFTEEFSSYDRFEYSMSLKTLINNTKSVSKIALLFFETDTAVTDATWTTIADCTNAFWHKYRVDITPIIKEISGPVAKDMNREHTSYYFFENYMLVLQSLEILKKPRGYAIYLIEKAEFEKPVNGYFDKETGNLAGMRLMLKEESKSTEGFSLSRQGNTRKISQKVIKTSSFPDCTYEFDFGDGMLRADKLRLLSITAFAVFTLLLGFGLAFAVSLIIFSPIELVMRHQTEKYQQELSLQKEALQSETLLRKAIQAEIPILNDRNEEKISDEALKQEETSGSSLRNASEKAALEHRIVCYVSENFCDSGLSLKGLSEQFDVSVSSISRGFKRDTNVNFLEYLTGLRMELAKPMLRIGERNIQDIAKEVGYESEYSFRRAFERYEGKSLQDYRREGKKK